MEKNPPVTPFLSVRNLDAVYENGAEGLEALHDLSFKLLPQQFVSVVGPSGSGKTTLLRILAGLLQPSSGEVIYANGETPHIGYVFQQPTLMPWRSVLDNIALPLEIDGKSVDTSRKKARELIELVGLNGFEDSWPGDLSGGMAQRVAIARALIQDPDLLLLDEPFGALDALTRERMGNELLRIWQASQKTVLLVTHSISEAIFLSDRVLVMTTRPGRIRLDLPIDLPWPREDDVRYCPHFAELSQRLRGAIEG